MKSPLAIWRDGKKENQWKVKPEMTVDLIITDFKRGNIGTKYENSLGSFICESSDGILKTDPSGIDDETRDKVWNNKEFYLGKIIEVKCNGISQDVNGNYSLLHPVFNRFRDDEKTEADNIGEIILNDNMTKGI